MVLTPGEDKFTQLNTLCKSKGSWDGGDQGILNEWRGSNWNRLSFTYNTTPTAAYTLVFASFPHCLIYMLKWHRYAPAYERFGSQISAVHFIGPNKPWDSLAYRAPFTNQSSSSSDSSQRAYDYDTLLDKWYSVYDKHHRSQPIIAQPSFELKRYESAWNETLDRGKQAALPAGTTLSLEELRTLAIEGMKASQPTFDIEPGEGEYQSLPLEGRVDLMRPKKTEEAVKPAPEATKQELKHKQKKRPPMLQNLSDSEELPQTHVAPQIQLQPASPPLRHALSTPAPDELPPSPRLKNISLPATPTPQPLPPHQHQFPAAEHKALSRADESQEQRERPGSQQERRSEPPPRPRSPPLLIWNPAIEPPPSGTPRPSAFPPSTYFPNVWDQTPSQQHDRPDQGSSPTPDSGAFFQAPPPTEIPEILHRQGHYRNVTGESNLGSPSPDRAKIKPVFTWEEQPRHMPGRVFPPAESPTPSLFLSPESQVSSFEVPTTPERKTTTPILSPLSGLPFTLTYTNAWDTVPSIQKYASRLVRPPAVRPLAPAFHEGGWEKKKSWDDKAEASSRDGDVEDEGDESDDDHVARDSIWGDDSDGEAASVSRQRPRRGSSASAAGAVSSKKKHREFGVQTISIEMKDQSVQVNTIHSKTDSSDLDRRPSMSSKRHWAPSGRTNAPPSVTTHAVNAQTESAAASHPGASDTASQLLSPASDASLPPSGRLSTKVMTSPLKAIAGSSLLTRQTSSDSSQGSPASSLGPVSPPDGHPIGSPLRKAGRVWDPARGVELIKRGSEEVIARFLKMGSSGREEENR